MKGAEQRIPVVAPVGLQGPGEPGLVSCIVPVFNGKRYVTEAVESILTQTYSRREVIVVNDGSSDGTSETLASYKDRIRVIDQQNQGPSVARNRGVQESRGAFLAFLDADDLWVEDKLSVQMSRFEARPELQVCSGHIKSFWIPELEHERRLFENHAYHSERAMFSPCTVLVRREVFVRVGGFDPQLRDGEDTDWFMRMMKAGIVYETVPRLLVRRRQHTGNLTRKVRPSPDAVLSRLKGVLDRERGR